MGLLGTLIEDNKMNILDKKTLWEQYHNLTFKAIDLVDGAFGKQWRIEVLDTTTGEIGFIFFSDKSVSRNNILTGLQEEINKTKQPYTGVALGGKLKSEGTKLSPATYVYWFEEWNAETNQQINGNVVDSKLVEAPF
jgi:hypothetical protein